MRKPGLWSFYFCVRRMRCPFQESFTRESLAPGTAGSYGPVILSLSFYDMHAGDPVIAFLCSFLRDENKEADGISDLWMAHELFPDSDMALL